MSLQDYKVTIEGVTKTYIEGTTFEEIAGPYQEINKNRIILVVANDRLMELSKCIQEDCVLKFITTDTTIGHNTCKRSLSMLYVKAVYDVIDTDKIDQVRLLFAVGNGYFSIITGDVTVDDELVGKIKNRMIQLVEADIPIEKDSIHTEEAVKLFHRYGMEDKASLFKYRRVSRVNIYKMHRFEDYYYGYMAPSTEYLKCFDLHLYKDGIVLQMPTKQEPEQVLELKPREQLFKVQRDAVAWGDLQEIQTVGDLNNCISKGNILDLILVQEAQQEKKIAEIASQIATQNHKKFILIAGPSSSGKTTFSHRLSIQLRANGRKPHPIALDNYFVNREDTPKDEMGNYDYECIQAIDVEQLNQDLMDLLDGKKVELPTFNFKKGEREYLGNSLQLGEDDVLVLEGIHGLNDALTYKLPKENKFKIYISALTQLNIDEHNRISTSEGRLLRRMVRDARTRGVSAKDTIAMWYSVRRGEEQNIFPYQEEADVMFNSACIYELAVLKQYVEPILFDIERDAPEYIEAKRLLKFLDYFIGIPSDYIPMNSLLKEFIGGSCF